MRSDGFSCCLIVMANGGFIIIYSQLCRHHQPPKIMASYSINSFVIYLGELHMSSTITLTHNLRINKGHTGQFCELVLYLDAS